MLANTLKLSLVSAADYDAIFYPGGYGPLWDLAEDKDSVALIEAFYSSGKPVSAVCHAPAVFRHTKGADGQPLVKGKKVTGFTNSEEEAVQLTDVVPFLVEDMLNLAVTSFRIVNKKDSTSIPGLDQLPPRLSNEAQNRAKPSVCCQEPKQPQQQTPSGTDQRGNSEEGQSGDG